MVQGLYIVLNHNCRYEEEYPYTYMYISFLICIIVILMADDYGNIFDIVSAYWTRKLRSNTQFGLYKNKYVNNICAVTQALVNPVHIV